MLDEEDEQVGNDYYHSNNSNVAATFQTTTMVNTKSTLPKIEEASESQFQESVDVT
jgi:hypothetical protein